MAAPSNEDRPVLFDSFKYTRMRPNVYLIDVLGDNVQVDSNSEWRKLGHRIARHLTETDRSAVLLSTLTVGELAADDYHPCAMSSHNSSSFDVDGRKYVLTSLEAAEQERILPGLIETSDFVFGLNVWLCFCEGGKTAHDLSHDASFMDEIKHMISNMDDPVRLDLTCEMIMAVPDGLEMWWFNPHPLALE